MPMWTASARGDMKGPATNQQPAGEQQPMGIMRNIHGNKLAKAPVPGVAGGKLTPGQQQQ